MLPAFADESVPGRVVKGLFRWGMNLATVQLRGLRGAADESLLEMAAAEGRIMLACDRDYLVLHAKWMRAGRNHAGMIFGDPNYVSIGQAIHRIVGRAAQVSRDQVVNLLIYL